MGRMRRTLAPAVYISSLLAAVLLWPIPLLASTVGTNYTVKSGGGGNYTTIQQCATAMAAGDTCTVFAGTYNENVTVSAGGVGAYKTLTVNGSDTVFVLSFTINPHVRINGFHIQNPSSPHARECVFVHGPATDVYITNNNMTECGTGKNGAIGVDYASGGNDAVSNSFVQGNTITYTCTTPGTPGVCRGMTLVGDHWMVENNDISHVSDGAYIFVKYLVVRGNTFHDIQSADCDSGSLSSNCHIDEIQNDPGSPYIAQFQLLEGNTVKNWVINGGGSGSNASHGGPLTQCNGGTCGNMIVRFQLDAHIDGAATSNDYGNWPNVKEYNNTWADMLHNIGAGAYVNNMTGATGGANLNEIYYFTTNPNSWNPYYYGSSGSGQSYGHALAFCPNESISACSSGLLDHSSGAFTGDPGNIIADPLFVNYAGNDFHLQATSPALGAGTNLTTASGSGTNSTSLTVADAGFFQDGWGFPAGTGLGQMTPDCLRIGSSTVVCIVARGINYSTNTLTLASPVSWNSNDPVYLYSDSSGTVRLTGIAPSIGAFGLPTVVGTRPAPPTQLTVVSVN